MRARVFWACLLVLWATPVFAQQDSYALEVLTPKTGLNSASRIYKAYPAILYEIPCAAIGGDFPYTYSLSNAPSGMTIDEDTGIISWPTPTTGTHSNIVCSVTDADSTVATGTWTLTVTTSGFNFVDAVNGVAAASNGCASSCGTGTLANPWRTMDDLSNEAVGGSLTYLRTGTYNSSGMTINGSGGVGAKIQFNSCCDSVTWMEYPGDTVTIDFEHTTGCTGYAFELIGAQVWVEGVTGTNIFVHGFTGVGADNAQLVFWRNTMVGADPTDCGTEAASGQVYLPVNGSGGSGMHYGTVILDNAFSGWRVSSAIKSYTQEKLLIARNTFADDDISSDGAMSVKGDHEGVEIRENVCTDIISSSNLSGLGGCIGSNMFTANDVRIRFNLIKNANTTYIGMWLNGTRDTVQNYYIHRNTIMGRIRLAACSGSGPYTFTNNVIVNDSDGSNTIPWISFDTCTNTSVVTSSSSLTPTGTQNLAGGTSAAIVDSNGLLQGSYRTTYLGLQGHEIDDGAVDPPTTAPRSRLRLRGDLAALLLVPIVAWMRQLGGRV